MKATLIKKEFMTQFPKVNNDNRKLNDNYVPFKREFEQNFLKLFGIIF